MCPEAHTFCKDVVASITKRTGLLRQKEVGSFLWSVGKGGGRRPQWLETSVRWRIGELPRIHLPRTRVNSTVGDQSAAPRTERARPRSHVSMSARTSSTARLASATNP